VDVKAEAGVGAIGGPLLDTKPERCFRGFADMESLWNALEKYHQYQDGAIIRKLDGGGHRGAGEGQGIQLSDDQIRVMEANQAIDHAMKRLAVVVPKDHLLLHHYYRRGLNEAAAGWVIAAAHAGLILVKKERSSRVAFDWALEQAVVLLFILHTAPRTGW
jgi:hypothetical protein